VTTIAVKAGRMACDSMEVIRSKAGGVRKYLNSDKVFECPGEFIGIAGESDGGLLWWDWYVDGCDSKKLERALLEYEIDVLILHKDGSVQTSSQACTFYTVREPFYAIGSGTKCALAAMHCGKTAAEAVAISALIDLNTGGDVQVFCFE